MQALQEAWAVAVVAVVAAAAGTVDTAERDLATGLHRVVDLLNFILILIDLIYDWIIEEVLHLR